MVSLGSNKAKGHKKQAKQHKSLTGYTLTLDETPAVSHDHQTHLTARLHLSVCPPTSWSDLMWLQSRRTTKAINIISNQGMSREAHVTLRLKPHTDMLSWIPHIPRSVSGSQQQASMSTYRITLDSTFRPALHLRRLKNTEGDLQKDKYTCHQRDSAGPACPACCSAGEFARVSPQ